MMAPPVFRRERLSKRSDMHGMQYILQTGIQTSRYGQFTNVYLLQLFFIMLTKINQLKMSDSENNNNNKSDDAAARAERAVKYNERFNVPEQTEEEEAETHGNAQAEHLADDREIQRRKKPS